MINTPFASPAAAGSSGTNSNTATGLPTSGSLNNMFLQLLVAQLQNQDPLDPLDPSQFVGQLAQFSELSEVTQIQQLLQQLATGGASSGSSANQTGNSASSTNSNSDVTRSGVVSSAASAAQQAIPNFTSLTSPLLNHQIQGVF